MFVYRINEIDVSFGQSKEEIKNIFDKLLNSQKCRISFINPEIFMQQEKNEVLHSYFKTCEYNFVDGIGLLYAINEKYQMKFDSSYRYTGTDFFEYLPQDRRIKIFFYGSKIENVLKAKEMIEKKYNNVQIVDYFDGYSKIEDDDLVKKINVSKPDILIVCLGCPKQEIWIQKNYEKLDSRIIFGNGGSIDFWSDNVKRAPVFFIKHGFEFLFRLFQNPTKARLKRQLKLFRFAYNYKKKIYNIEKIKEI